jgi:hypothetical protein
MDYNSLKKKGKQNLGCLMMRKPILHDPREEK